MSVYLSKDTTPPSIPETTIASESSNPILSLNTPLSIQETMDYIIQPNVNDQETPQEIEYTPIEYPWENNSGLEPTYENTVPRPLAGYEGTPNFVDSPIDHVQAENVERYQTWIPNGPENDVYYQSFPLDNAVETNVDNNNPIYPLEEDRYEIQAVQDTYSENSILEYASSMVPNIITYDVTTSDEPAENILPQQLPLFTDEITAAAVPVPIPAAKETADHKDIPPKTPEPSPNKEPSNNVPPPRPQRKPLGSDPALPQPDTIPAPAAAAQQPEAHYPISLPPGSDLGTLGQIGIFESSSPSPSEGLQSILFWVCILSLFFTFNNGRPGN
ncbi:hypothetical protein CLU79DRAFT_837705 [Phycomyces nitens]|nr:hypothetical protein CLU79DRAFT_837705 [Phycomyces nitens]